MGSRSAAVPLNVDRSIHLHCRPFSQENLTPVDSRVDWALCTRVQSLSVRCRFSTAARYGASARQSWYATDIAYTTAPAVQAESTASGTRFKLLRMICPPAKVETTRLIPDYNARLRCRDKTFKLLINLTPLSCHNKTHQRQYHGRHRWPRQKSKFVPGQHACDQGARAVGGEVR